MKVSGTYTFDGTCEEVFELLTDVSVLRRAIPGCRRLEPIGEDSYEADLKLGLAGIRGDYSGTVRLSDQQPPRHYRMDVQGKGSNGFVKGSGAVELEEQDNRTTMRYTGDAQIGGALASIGQRLLDGAARTVINQGLKSLSAELAARKSGADTTAEQTGATAPTAASATARQADTDAQQQTAPAAPAPPAASEPPGLTTTDVLRGAAEDLVAARPYLRWALPAVGGLLLGFLLGRSSK